MFRYIIGRKKLHHLNQLEKFHRPKCSPPSEMRVIDFSNNHHPIVLKKKSITTLFFEKKSMTPINTPEKNVASPNPKIDKLLRGEFKLSMWKKLN